MRRRRPSPDTEDVYAPPRGRCVREEPNRVHPERHKRALTRDHVVDRLNALGERTQDVIKFRQHSNVTLVQRHPVHPELIQPAHRRPAPVSPTFDGRMNIQKLGRLFAESDKEIVGSIELCARNAWIQKNARVPTDPRGDSAAILPPP